jgi:hypothetical protein
MVDAIEFSRPKKNINRDFSDAMMMAELIDHYLPKKVELHSYPATSSTTKKIANWDTLNSKVLKKLGIGLSKKEIEDIANCVPLAIETYLYEVLRKFESPEEEVNISQQINKLHPVGEPKARQSSNIGNNMQNSAITETNIVGENTEHMKETKKHGGTGLTLGNETDEIFNLIESIESSYAKLLNLQETSKMKDEIIKNLEKKI